MAMVGITLTLFDNTRNIEKQKSKIEYAKATLNQEKLRDAIKLELKKAVLNLETKEKILLEKMEAKKVYHTLLRNTKISMGNFRVDQLILLLSGGNKWIR